MAELENVKVEVVKSTMVIEIVKNSLETIRIELPNKGSVLKSFQNLVKIKDRYDFLLKHEDSAFILNTLTKLLENTSKK